MKRRVYSPCSWHRIKGIGLMQLLLMSQFAEFTMAETKPSAVIMPSGGFAPVVIIPIRGKVVDATGGAIPGATVVLKGSSSLGTTTDADGAFILNVPDGSTTLVVSSIGFMAQEIAIGNQSQLLVTLQSDVKALSEVVVTGYSSQSRRDITGSVATVDAKELTKVTAPNVAQQLQGRVAGVTVTSNNSPGGEATVRIRGFGTINNNDPLYIIDGVPTKGGLNSINPNNIESMQVLKDASSASIYGSRAANGVIIITTKKGRIGTPQFTFNSRAGVQIGKVDLGLIKDPQDFGNLLWTQRRNAGVLTNGNPSHQQYGNGPTAVVPDYILAGASYGLAEGDPRVNPALYNYNRTGFYQIVKANREGTDWEKEILHPASIQEYNIGANGGTESGRYAISLNYFKQDGVMIHTGFDRYSLRSNTEFLFKKRIRLGENLEVSYTDNKGYYNNNGTASTANNQDGNPIGNGYRIPSIIPVYDIMGNFAATRAAGLGPATNPVAQLWRSRNNKTSTFRTFGNAYLEVDVLKNLVAKSSIGIDYTNANRVGYTLLDLEEAEIEAANSLVNANAYDINWTWSNTLNYSAAFGSNHKLNVLAGTEAIKGSGRDFSATRTTFFSEDPLYMFLNSGTAGINNTGGGYEWALFSVFGKVNYSLNDRYLLEATIRRDGSSRFGQNNRYGTFPAFSAGWRISEEGFMAGLPWINDLKIRAGWGQTGNQEIGNYNGFSTYRSSLSQSSYAIDGSNNSVQSGFDTEAFGNPDAKWETTTQTNLGLDATFMKGKLGLTLDLFNRTTSDMLYQVSLPATQGVATIPFVNIGEMNNKGIDLNLTYNNKALNGNLTYGVGVNFSTYKNKVVRLNSSSTAVLLGPAIRSYTWTRSVAGMPLFSFYGLKIDGIYQNQSELDAGPAYPGYAAVGKYKYHDTDGDGTITDNDRMFLGNPHPDFTYGVNLNLGYKNFDLSAFFQGVQGNQLLNMVKRWVDFNNQAGNRSLRMLNDSWTPENPDAVLPILDANDSRSQQPSSYFIEDGSYLRLKNLTIGYTLPASVASKIKFESARVFVQAQNLFTITKYSGIDPEVTSVGSSPGSTVLGVDQGNYPNAKMYQIGINFGF
ncbi:SusC/RagA family TonB-linked outer membrane protein [Spirosoma utsteinense]|uniref:TonB-linked SusC/RagA family outer membrane protein n=1 Tax=Spirosoma utsteinense TaxID=2585773 RepID=A0ABR6WBZ9_9BACT|nr:TonB-dependent receptor [Spirosoma utsteinense]MBC3787585.1 TonB-linked SusC/RagA family outer membrane protein [Spirosoma utsteinense]MBC3794099.1 TonB-linked SusC/RagA family outer membrane protein [Spirosoma utsteinense]